MPPEIKRDWFIHRIWPKGNMKLTIIWAKNPGENVCDWVYKIQFQDLSNVDVDSLPDIK